MNVYLAEFIGITIIIFLGCGVLAGNSLKKSGSYGAGNVAINLTWASAVALAVYISGDISGGHFNPAVTIANAIRGTFSWRLVPGYIIAQVLGAMFGALLVYLQYLPHWKETDDEDVKLKVFATSPAIRNNITNFMSEYFVTFGLVFCTYGLDTNRFTDGLKPLIAGVLIFVLGTSFGGVTGCAINPARDLGPRIVHFLLPIVGKGDSDFSYAWVPIVGPIMGGSTAAMVHVALYEGVIDFRLISLLALTVVILVIIKLKSKDEIKEQVNYMNEAV